MKEKVYIILFVVLYLIVAFSSFFHAVEFFELSNVQWMSVILALAFEIGQAAVLMSILTSKEEQSKFTPWLLMIILTLVQIIGNVYSSYRYILQNSLDNLKFFKEPIFIWTNLPDDQATVIVTYVSASILPIVALLMTSLITNYINKSETTQVQELEKKEEIIEDKNSTKIETQIPQVKNRTSEEILDNLKKEIDNGNFDKIINKYSNGVDYNPLTDEEVDYDKNEIHNKEEVEEKIDENVEDLFGGVIPQNVSDYSKKSHFINI